MVISKRAHRWGWALLLLFALPFAAVGIGATYWTLQSVSEHAAMQAWVETAAFIQHADLKRQGRSDGETSRAVARYEYEFAGRRHTGERVALHRGSDSIGTFQRDAYNELSQHRLQNQPFRCFVNPQNPAEAVLYRDLRWERLAFETLFGTVFGSIGLGFLTGAFVYARKTPGPVSDDIPDDQPWLMRTDWAAGEISAAVGSVMLVPVLAVVAVYWNAASAPLGSQLPGFLLSSESPFVWLTLVFPLVGFALIALLVYQFVQARKFGTSTLELATIPGVVGGKLAGIVRIQHAVEAAEGFRLVLSCREQVKERDKTHDEVLWQDELLVLEPLRDPATGSIALPVVFAIPYTAQETSRPGAKRHIKWQLEVTARLPGVNYRTRYEVPVFKTAESRPDFKLDGELSQFIAAPPRDVLLRGAGIAKEPLAGGGIRLIFPAARNLGSAIGLTMFLAIWSGAIWMMLHLGAPIFFPVVFGVIELFVIWIVVELWLYRSVVEARSDGLTFRGGLLGIGRRRSWLADDVKRFGLTNSMSSGTHVWKNIVVFLRGGGRRTIAQAVHGKLAQQAVIDELNAALKREGAEAETIEVESEIARRRRERREALPQ